MTRDGAGEISDEVNQLVGRPSIASGRERGCPALPFDAAHLRALLIGSADFGEILMRALSLRRVALIDEGGAGAIVIGAPGSPDVVRLQTFLTRADLPNLLLDAGSDDEGRALVERMGVAPRGPPRPPGGATPE